MTEEQILAVLDIVDEFDVRIGGGWGIDALVGYQTRAHHDADLLIGDEKFAAARAKLVDAGFSVTLDEMPDRVVFDSPALGRVDLNNLVFVKPVMPTSEARTVGSRPSPTGASPKVS